MVKAVLGSPICIFIGFIDSLVHGFCLSSNLKRETVLRGTIISWTQNEVEEGYIGVSAKAFGWRIVGKAVPKEWK